MYMRAAAVEIAAGGRPPPHLSFDFDSSIMVSKLTANRTGVVDDCESTCSPVRQGIFVVPFFLPFRYRGTIARRGKWASYSRVVLRFLVAQCRRCEIESR